MNSSKICLAIVFITLSCTARDFFSYRENTGQYVIEREDYYSSIKFGTKLAASSEDSRDFLAVSAGAGYGTEIYKLSDSGRLLDIDGPSDSYLTAEDEQSIANTAETGTSIVGLPFWGAGSTGCFAIGEPGASQVILKCRSDNDIHEIKGPKDSGFGVYLSAIRPSENDPWLLAVASETGIIVFSDHKSSDTNSSDEFFPEEAESIVSLAAGRSNNDIIVAAGANVKGSSKVFLFRQHTTNSRTFDQIACIDKPDDPGFGGVLALADLNLDGVDELLVSALSVPNRKEAVYIYDLSKPFKSPECKAEDPLTISVPEDGDLEIECEAGCNFGTVITVGDIATDDSGLEIAIGAPGARVDGKDEAGAVYLFRSDGTAAGQIADSTPKSGHHFGGGLTVAPMAGRNELIVGEVGAGEVIIAFCTGVGEDLTKGSDTTRDGSKKVISTRCRL